MADPVTSDNFFCGSTGWIFSDSRENNPPGIIGQFIRRKFAIENNIGQTKVLNGSQNHLPDMFRVYIIPDFLAVDAFIDDIQNHVPVVLNMPIGPGFKKQGVTPDFQKQYFGEHPVLVE